MSDKDKLTYFAVIGCILCFCIAFTFLIVVDIKNSSQLENVVISDDNIDIEYIKTDDLKELSELIAENQEKMDAAYYIIEYAETLKYDSVVGQAAIDFVNYRTNVEYYTEVYNNKLSSYNSIKEKYPVATYIWIRLKLEGFNDYVCAGILGNIMTEVGGQTLNLVEECWDKTHSYYGICQWRSKYYPDVSGKSLEEQVNFLFSNMEKIINIYGDYNQFIFSEDESAAALMFAKWYERCGIGSYNSRQENAKKALLVFTEEYYE